MLDARWALTLSADLFGAVVASGTTAPAVSVRSATERRAKLATCQRQAGGSDERRAGGPTVPLGVAPRVRRGGTSAAPLGRQAVAREVR